MAISRAPCTEMVRFLVQAGDEVKAGATIARVGSGDEAVKPHVHFEVRKQGQLVDPLPMIEKAVRRTQKPNVFCRTRKCGNLQTCETQGMDLGMKK